MDKSTLEKELVMLRDHRIHYQNVLDDIDEKINRYEGMLTYIGKAGKVCITSHTEK